MSVIERFLNIECVYSQFDTDYISFEQLKFVYAVFCKTLGIPESKRAQIIGSDGIIKFGAKIKDMIPPARIVGIKAGKLPVEEAKRGVEETTGCIRRETAISSNLKARLMSIDGLVPNAAVGVVHFALIHFIPFFTPIITFLSVVEMTVLNPSVYARPNTFFDFYSTNRLNPWWYSTPYVPICAYVNIYVLFFLGFAYIELFSFYMTGLDNNGKFPVAYTFMKRFFMIGFYIALGFYIFLYFAMIWFVFVWCVLAGILNPSVLLPYTAAALTFLYTITAKYTEY